MKFAIYGQTNKSVVQDIVKRLLKVFETYKPTIIFEEEFHSLLQDIQLLPEQYTTFKDDQSLPEDVDFFIGIGGDGTMLRAADFIKTKNIQ